MKNGFFGFIDNYRKDVKPWSKNWFFAVTIFIVIFNVVLHAALGRGWGINTDNEYTPDQIAQGFAGNKSHWHYMLYFASLMQSFLSAFSHLNWQHVLLNMLCFLFCGIYLERKIGSLNMFLLVVGFAFFGGCAVSANNVGIDWRGYSGVNYSFYAYILIDYIFIAAQKTKRNKFDLISGGVMLGLIYFAMCFSGGTSSVGFEWFPYDAITNLGHYTSYLVGLIMAGTIQLFVYFSEKKLVTALKEKESERT